MPMPVRVPILALFIFVLVHSGAFARQDRPAGGSKSGGAYHQFMVGRWHEGRSEIEEAIEAYKAAIGLDPSSAEVHAALCELYLSQERLSEALTVGQRALQLDPQHAVAHQLVGVIFARLAESPSGGQHVTRAIEHLERANRLAPLDSSTSLVLARLYLSRADFARALPLLVDAVENDPDSTGAVMLLAETMVGLGRRSNAIELLRETVDKHPRALRTALYLAELYEQERRWDAAAQVYGRLIGLDPGNDDLRLRQASVWVRAGESRRARELLGQIVAGGREDPQVLFLLSEAERQSGNLEAAEAAAQRLTALEPQGMRGPYALAQVFESKREYRRAIEALQTALAAARRGSDARQISALLVRTGFAHQQLREFNKAIAFYEEAHSVSRSDPLPLIHLVQAHLLSGDTQKALDVVGRSRETFPDNVSFRQLEAEALRRSGRVEEAIARLEEGVRERPNEVESHLALAELYMSDRRFRNAGEVLERASAGFPENLELVFRLGAAYERGGRTRDAERQFSRVLEKDAGHARALNYLGYMLADRGERLDHAIDLIHRALALDPHNGSYLDSLGWAYFRIGKLDQAVQHLRKAAHQLPTNSVIQDHLGQTLFRVGLVDEAIVTWERALQGDGEEIDRAEIQRRIKTARSRQ